MTMPRCGRTCIATFIKASSYAGIGLRFSHVLRLSTACIQPLQWKFSRGRQPPAPQWFLRHCTYSKCALLNQDPKWQNQIEPSKTIDNRIYYLCPKDWYYGNGIQFTTCVSVHEGALAANKNCQSTSPCVLAKSV